MFIDFNVFVTGVYIWFLHINFINRHIIHNFFNVYILFVDSFGFLRKKTVSYTNNCYFFLCPTVLAGAATHCRFGGFIENFHILFLNFMEIFPEFLFLRVIAIGIFFFWVTPFIRLRKFPFIPIIVIIFIKNQW